MRTEYVLVEECDLSKDPAEVLCSEDASGYCRRAGARRRQRRFDEAISDYQQAFQQAPQNADIQRLMALTYHMQGNLAAANEAYSRAASIFRENGNSQKADNIEQMLLLGLQPIENYGPASR